MCSQIIPVRGILLPVRSQITRLDQIDLLQHLVSRLERSSVVSKTTSPSRVRTMESNMQPQKHSQNQREQQRVSSSSHHVEQSDLKKRIRNVMLLKALMRYLKREDPDMHRRAREVEKECCKKKKQNHPEYSSVSRAMNLRLREIVDDSYWHKAEKYVERYFQRKKKLQSTKRGIRRNPKRKASSKMKPRSKRPPRPSRTSQSGGRRNPPHHQAQEAQVHGGVSSSSSLSKTNRSAGQELEGNPSDASRVLSLSQIVQGLDNMKI